jgi:D-alanyl-D-alanine carboxypeptidase
VKQLINILLLNVILLLSAGQAMASRHAVFVYDAANGRVLHQENGTAQRYPASLTKMMTLYLLFEHLQNGRTSMQSPMNVSALAASQPQTNISLRRGAKLTVEQGIKALVVRSANDAAVVVAEHVAGSVPNFARLATAKARMLGMVHTRFKNPHGLPDNGQVTTARDMALLGAALRRDFPQYFPLFTTKEFIYQGRRYGSHNRVVGRLKGVDGIKTGYINASGFNLVSSFKQDGFNIVGVVMGGNTAAERDNRMVALLQRTHQKLLAERKTGVSNAYASLSVPKPLVKPAINMVQAAEKRIPVNNNSINNVAMAKSPLVAKPNNFNIALKDGNAQANHINVAFNNMSNNYVKNAVYNVPAPVAKLGANATANVDKGWAVQIGVFREPESAKLALKKVAGKVGSHLGGAVAYVEYAEQGANVLHRARLKNLSQQNAATVCQKLQTMRQDCFVTKIN